MLRIPKIGLSTITIFVTYLGCQKNQIFIRLLPFRVSRVSGAHIRGFAPEKT